VWPHQQTRLFFLGHGVKWLRIRKIVALGIGWGEYQYLDTVHIWAKAFMWTFLCLYHEVTAFERRFSFVPAGKGRIAVCAKKGLAWLGGCGLNT